MFARIITKAEKIGTFLSAAALVVAVISPIATYLWLDPKIKEFNDRARLQVAGDFTKYISNDNDQYANTVRWVAADSYYDLKTLNSGKLPAKEVQIVVQFNESPPSGEFFTFDPPLQYEVRPVGNQFFITLKRSLPPEGSIKVTFKQIPSLLTVSTESGETNVINTSAGVIRQSNMSQLMSKAIKQLIDKYPKGTPISEIFEKELKKPQKPQSK